MGAARRRPSDITRETTQVSATRQRAKEGTHHMLDDPIKAQLTGYFERIQRPIELVASLDDSEASRETLELLQEIAALSDRIALDRRRRRSAPALVRRPPLGRGRRHRVRRSADGPRIQLAGARPAASRRPSAQDRGRGGRADQGARGRIPVRDLLLPVLPELPRGRAGAQRHQRAQPSRPPRRDRRRGLPGRNGSARDHGGPRRIPERQAVRKRTHEPGGDPRQARQRVGRRATPSD